MISKVETSHLNRGDKCFHGIELMKTTTFAFSDITATFSNFSYICTNVKSSRSIHLLQR